MSGSLARQLVLVASVVASATIGAASVSAQEEENAASQMYFDVGNPSPGDTIHVGGLKIEGIAFDRTADESPGIERVDIFLEDRDQAGTLIGHAAVGVPTPAADDPELANSGWNAEVMLTRHMTGPHTMFFYAMSGVTGEEIIIAVPVQVAP
jgi:hypothetical protein